MNGPGKARGVTGGSAAPPGGCGVTWKHTGTGASLGPCGGYPEHQVTASCPRCQSSGTVRVCRSCWGSYRTGGLCGTCMEPLEIMEQP